MSGFQPGQLEKGSDGRPPPPVEDTLVASNPFDEPPMRFPMPGGPFDSGPCCGPTRGPGPPFYPGNFHPFRGHPAEGMPGPGMGMVPLAGRVYPLDQSVVRTNPNAPPIFPCGLCHKEIHENEQAIQCEEGCRFHFHRTCSKLTEDAFKMLMEEPFASWVCDNCWMAKTMPSVKSK